MYCPFPCGPHGQPLRGPGSQSMAWFHHHARNVRHDGADAGLVTRADSAQALAAACSFYGIKAEALPPLDSRENTRTEMEARDHRRG
jgi:hypothetical protein